ncbi:MAG: type II secretion system protein [Candidatus Omnitrophota bacterium]
MKKKNGFTLIEVLGAIVILSIMIVPVIGLIQSTLIMSQRQEGEIKCLYLAQQKMEEEIQLLKNDFTTPSYQEGVIEGNYKFRIVYSADGPIDILNLKVVEATVWVDENASDWPPDSAETKVVLSAKIANY